MSIDRWKDKEDVVSIKICHCSNMDGLGGYYVKWNKFDRERQILYDVIYMWNLKKLNKLMNTTAKTSKPIENKLVVTSVEGKGRGEGQHGLGD